MVVTGYFTIESNIMSLSAMEIAGKLGFNVRLVTDGLEVLELLRRPLLGEFELGGSTLFAGRDGLAHGELKPNTIPFAWTNQRLVKVRPVLAGTSKDDYPPALGARAEQWVLNPGISIPARLIRRLRTGERYWGR